MMRSIDQEGGSVADGVEEAAEVDEREVVGSSGEDGTRLSQYTPKKGASSRGECMLKLWIVGGVLDVFGWGAVWEASADPGSASRLCLLPGKGLGVRCVLAEV